jgi:hypothetical protein
MSTIVPTVIARTLRGRSGWGAGNWGLVRIPAVRGAVVHWRLLCLARSARLGRSFDGGDAFHRRRIDFCGRRGFAIGIVLTTVLGVRTGLAGSAAATWGTPAFVHAACVVRVNDRGSCLGAPTCYSFVERRDFADVYVTGLYRVATSHSDQEM